jgi:quercetin dioxygenase-like cupin family protein
MPRPGDASACIAGAAIGSVAGPGQSTKGQAMGFQSTLRAVPTLQQDDEIARITRWDFEPGATTGWHEHGFPYFVVMLQAGILKIHDGTVETAVPLAEGQSYRRPAGIRHDVMNGSLHPIAFVEIEIKQPDGLRA